MPVSEQAYETQQLSVRLHKAAAWELGQEAGWVRRRVRRSRLQCSQRQGYDRGQPTTGYVRHDRCQIEMSG